MSEFRGSYLGFTYGKKSDGTPMHSSDLGIVRTSDGSRFNENLLPTIQDKTVQVPGGDGTYYFGSYYTQKQFTVPFAFDSLSEEQVLQLRKHFGDKKIHDLIFDEMPYKAYRAKVTGTAQIKHIVFDEGPNKKRVYKGEGTIQFTCYQPYAVCKKKVQSDYPENKYPNRNEWWDSSRLQTTLDEYDSLEDGKIKLYNAGDIDTHFEARFGFFQGTIPAGGFYLDANRQLKWEEMSPQGNQIQGYDDMVVFNSKLNLIEGYRGGQKSGYLYNQYITEGDFFAIPTGESDLIFSGEFDNNFKEIEYFYYYF